MVEAAVACPEPEHCHFVPVFSRGQACNVGTRASTCCVAWP